VVDCCIVVYLTLRQQQDCGGGESKSRARVAGNSHVDKMEGERSEKNPSGVRAGLVIMGI